MGDRKEPPPPPGGAFSGKVEVMVRDFRVYDLPMTVHIVSLAGPGGSWSELFSSVAERDLFIKGAKAGAAVFGHRFVYGLENDLPDADSPDKSPERNFNPCG